MTTPTEQDIENSNIIRNILVEELAGLLGVFSDENLAEPGAYLELAEDGLNLSKSIAIPDGRVISISLEFYLE